MALLLVFRSKNAKNYFHLAVLLTLGVIVLGSLWTREIRVAAASGKVDMKRLADPYLNVYGCCVTCSEINELGLDYPLSDVPTAEDPERIKAILPAGSTYDIIVKGGFVAERNVSVRCGLPRGHLAYAFEMSYQRLIESNDGHRIVERRSFGPVRMAKILSPADNMQLDLGPHDQLVFDGRAFPDQATGITAGPLRPVAKAMLGAGVEDAIQFDTSVALLERDFLSGKTVRITYMNGVGIESVEGLGWSLTGSRLMFLFSQTILPPVLPSGPVGDQRITTKYDALQLISFSDPARLPATDTEVLLETLAANNGKSKGLRILRIPYHVYGENGDASPTLDQIRTASAPIGEIRFDTSGAYVTQATIRWLITDLEVSADRLLYEFGVRDFHDVPILTVHYHCENS